MSVKILYLYPDFMSLYGDNGNVRILARRLEDQGLSVEITKKTITDDLSFEGFDFVYMGSGFESNRNLVSAHMNKFKDGFVKAVDDGMPMLFTGNSYDILGKGGGESWLGEGEQVSAHAANLVFGECDMTNLSEDRKSVV